MPFFENAPVLYSDLWPVWNAFAQLCSRRQSGFGPCPLSMGDIVLWLDENGISGTGRRRWYIKLIIALDNHWLKKAGEKEDQK